MKKVLTALALAASMAGANAALYQFTNEFSGGADCANAATGCATLEVTASGLDTKFKLTGTMSGNEFITGLYGNINPYHTTTLSGLGGSGSDSFASFTVLQDSFKADGDGFFDWRLDLSTNPPRFASTDVLEFTLVGVNLLEATSGLSVNGGDPTKNGFRFAIHAQGLAEGSGWFNGLPDPTCVDCVPDPRAVVSTPGTSWLAGLGLIGIALMRAGRNQKA